MQFYRLYLKDCMIRVPWLNINYMSPVNLLTPNDDSLIRAAIAELGIDGPVSSYLNTHDQTTHGR